MGQAARARNAVLTYNRIRDFALVVGHHPKKQFPIINRAILKTKKDKNNELQNRTNPGCPIRMPY